MGASDDGEDMVLFVVRELISGPVDLREQLPVTVTALNALPDEHGGGNYWCARLEQPVKYRFTAQCEPSGVDSQFVAEDAEGTFVWVYVLVLTATDKSPLEPGRTGVAAEIGYVTDLSLSTDTYLVSDKIRWTAFAVLDVTSEATDDPNSSGDGAANRPTVSGAATTETPGATGVTSELADLTASPTAAVSTPPPRDPVPGGGLVTRILSQVDTYLAQLADLAGVQFSDDIPRAVHLRAGQQLPTDKPTFMVEGPLLRYHSLHPVDGWQWRTTQELDVLVYWIVDDVVRSLAAQWSTRAPAAAGMDRQQIDTLLWIPYWLTMLAALNPQWYTRTQAFIDSRGRC